MGLFDLYFRALVKGKYVVVLFWLVVLIVGVIYGPKLLSSTQDSFDAPEGSASYEAQKVYEQNFPLVAHQNTLIVLVHSERSNTSIVQGSYLSSVQSALSKAIHQYSDQSIINGVVGYYSFPSTMDQVRQQFLSADERYALIIIQYHNPPTIFNWDFINYCDDLVNNKLPVEIGNYTLGLTGTEAMFADVNKGTEKDMVRIDSIVLPLAFGVLALYLRSLRLMILPLLSLITSILASYSVMLTLTSVLHVAAVAPSVMMSLSIAMCIDYNLFLLTRLREEIISGNRTPLLGVYGMLRSAGHVVLVSGTTLAITFLGLAFFPMEFLRTLGIGGALAILMTLVINLTLTPAILLIFPNFFTNFSVTPRMRRWCPRFLIADLPDETPSPQDPNALAFDARHSHHTPLMESPSTPSHRETLEAKATHEQNSSFWFKSAKLSTHTRYSIIILIIVLAILLPVSFQTLEMKYTVDNIQLFPRDSPALAVFKQLQANFAPGRVSDYKILMSIENNNQSNVNGGVSLNVMTPTYFSEQAILIDALLKNGNDTSISSITYAGGQQLTLDMAKIALQISPSYQYVYNTSVNLPYSNTSIIDLVTTFDPLSDTAEPWVRNMRSLLNRLSNDAYEKRHLRVHYYLLGGICETVDAIEQVFSLFPILVGLTVSIVFVIVAVVFRSVFVPFRLIFSIGLSITFTYGLSLYVFQDNKFDVFSSNLKDVHALYWLTPVMSFSILVGLGLDYDVFLYSRIVEYRKNGYTNRAAILKGVYRTGSIITGAGVIMAISFGGLMLSEEMVLNEFGFMLSFAVLLDTFIVRTLAVPATLHLAGNANWWPLKMPHADKDENDHSDLTMDLQLDGDVHAFQPLDYNEDGHHITDADLISGPRFVSPRPDASVQHETF